MALAECQNCGRLFEGSGTLCSSCVETTEQSTTSFVPVGSADIDKTSAVKQSISDDAFLQVVKGPQVGERFLLEGERIVIGRDPNAELFLADITVSREHAEIVREDGADIAVRDLGSLNGTYVNGEIAEEANLKSGDVIQIGTFQLMFCWGYD